MEWLLGVVVVIVLLAAWLNDASGAAASDGDGESDSREESDDRTGDIWTSPAYWYVPGNLWHDDDGDD